MMVPQLLLRAYQSVAPASPSRVVGGSSCSAIRSLCDSRFTKSQTQQLNAWKQFGAVRLLETTQSPLARMPAPGELQSTPDVLARVVY